MSEQTRKTRDSRRLYFEKQQRQSSTSVGENTNTHRNSAAAAAAKRSLANLTKADSGIYDSLASRLATRSND